VGLEILYRLLILASLLGGSVREGFAPHYAPGVMERVSRVRDLPIVSCMVASPLEEIGAWVYVYGVRTGALRYCRVTDTSQARDRARHLRTRRYVELDYGNTIAICGTTRGRADACPVVVVRIQ
jgi:hypothetical protein